MKNFKSILLAVLFPMSGFSQYCIPTYNNSCLSDDYIDNFTLNTLSVLGSGCNGNPNNYILDLVNTTSLNAGGFYLMTMQSGPAWDQGFGVWIDYNQDGDFGDPGEFVFSSPGSSTMPFSTSIAVPCDAVLGATRLRVRCQYGSTLTWADTCNLMPYGETEDYNITIQPPSIPGPSILLSDTCLIYGVVFIGATKYDTLTISNIGCDTLFITSISSSLPQFVPDTNGLTLLPGTSYPLVVAFNPAAAIPYSGILTLLNNDNDTTICLTGTGLLPPVIGLTPDSFEVTLTCSDTLIDTLTISNTGNSNLEYSVTILPSASNTDFYDGFEGGDISTWNIGAGSYQRDVITANPANGKYCERLIKTGGGGYDGINHSFTPGTPDFISFKVRSQSGSFVNNCSVEIGQAADILFNGSLAQFWIGNGAMQINLWTPSNWITFPLVQDQWYKIDFRNINYTAKTFDYYIDDSLIFTGVAFWNNLIASVDVIHLFSWDNDTSFFDEIIIGSNFPLWLQPQPPLAGITPPAGSDDIPVLFSSAGILAGQYFGRIYVQSNDPANPQVSVPCTLNVVGNPAIALSDTCLDFDTIYQFGSVIDTLFIGNSGCDTLFIDSIIASNSDFTIDTVSPYILPFDSSGIAIVRFSPLLVTTYNETLTLYTNAADTSICLIGVSLPPPTIVINPVSYNVFVACDDSLIDTLNIANSGASNLIFNITGCGGPPPLQSVLNLLNMNYASITALVPSIFNFSEGDVGDSIDDGGNDMYDWGNYLNTNLGTKLAYSDNNIIPSAAMGAGGRYFTRKNPGLFVFTADVNNISWFELTGDNGADGGGNMDATVLTTQLCGVTYKGFVKRVYNAGDPSINHLIIIEDRPGINHNYSTNTNDDQHRVFNLNSTTRIYYLLYASSFGGYVDNSTTISIMNEFLQQVAGNGVASWAALSNVTDTVSPGANTDIQVFFNSVGKNAGVYNTYYVVSSNDPQNPVDTIPVTMNVTGSPAIELSDTCIVFDTIYQFGSVTDTLFIANNGCDTLFIDSLIATNIDFSIDTVSQFVLPDDTGLAIVRFSPQLIADYNAILNIYTNLPDTSICLKGVSLPPPTISTNPTSFTINLGCNDTTNSDLKVYNTGASDLYYNLNDFLDSLVYNESFVNGVTPVAQAAAWVAYRSQLTPRTYSRLTISGSVNPVGITLTDTAAIADIANALRLGQNFSVTVGANTWYVGVGCGPGAILSVNTTVCNCDAANPVVYVIRPEIGNANWGGINTVTCSGPTQTMRVAFTYGTMPGWMAPSIIADTVVPADSSIINIQFVSTGLLVGQYNSAIVISSNDPVTPSDTVPVTLNVIGGPEIIVSDSCIIFDTIFQLGTITDTLYYTNAGCDTLFIDSLLFTNVDFGIDTFVDTIVPGDTGFAILRFSPLAIGNYSDSLLLFNNDTDLIVCLNGVSLPPPTIVVDPDTFLVTLGCNDSITLPLDIINIGASDLIWNANIPSDFFDDFNPGIDGSLWSSTTGTATINCSVVSGNNMWFGNAGIRQATTIDWNTLIGGTISFYLRLPQLGGSPCESADNSGENVVLEYSTNGGGSWTNISSYTYNAYPNLTFISVPIPAGAQTPSTRFRWRQLGNSGAGFDHWLLENVLIDVIDFATLSLTADTTPPSDTTVVNVEFNSLGLTIGVYNSVITINSNDPSNPVVTIPATLNVVGTANMDAVIMDTVPVLCLDLDSIMEFTTSTDSIRIYNTGCDTLFIDSVIFSTSHFSLVSGPGSFLMGTNGTMVIRFSPDSAGPFNSTVSIYTNELDTVICLYGEAYPRPVISWNPDSFNITLPCSGSALDSLTVYNTGLSDLIYSTSYLVTGNSMLVDGVNDYMGTLLDIDQGAASPGATFEAWVYPLSTSAGNHQVINSDNAGFDWGILRNGGSWYVFSGAANVNTGFTVDVNKWQHIAGVFIPGIGVRFYKNGQQFTSASIGTDAADAVIELGRNSGGGELFDGRIDEARVWNIQRSQAAIQSTMNKRLFGNEPGLLGYWNYDDGTPNDASQNGYNGTFFNGAAAGIPNAPVSPSWMSYSNNTNDTINPADSVKIGLAFDAGNLIIGQYTSGIVVSSNDPLNPNDTVPVILTVVGASDFQFAGFTDTAAPLCLYLDSIMEFTQSTANILITNTGCDTLFIDSVFVSPYEFSLDSVTPYILPDDTGVVVVRFSPDSVAVFTGTVDIFTDDIDTVFCLKGQSYPRPTLFYIPDSFTVTLPCSGSSTDTLTVFNTGLSDLIYSTSYLVTGNSMLVDGINDYMTTTLNIDQGPTSPGATFEAWVYPFSTSAGNHQVISSDDGGFDWGILRNGGLWYIFSGAANVNTGFTVDVNKWQHIAGVFIPGTGVRFYKNGQQFTSASIGTDASDVVIEAGRNSGGGELFDGRIDEARVWNIQRSQADIISTMNKRLYGNEPGLLAYWNYDDGTPSDGSQNGYNGTFFNGAAAGIPNAPVSPSWFSYANVASDTVAPADSAKLGVEFDAGNLIIGQYSSEIVLSSNDPFNPADTIPVILTVIGASDFEFAGFADTIAPLCLDLDSIMEFTTSTDTIYLTNLGCDTLFIDSMAFSLSEFTLVDFTPIILPDDTGGVIVRFAPVSVNSFTGTLNLYTDDMDTVFCLKGQSYPRPVICYFPDTINVTLACCDSFSAPLAICNSGGSDLFTVMNLDTCPLPLWYDDFEDGDYAGWITGTCGYTYNVLSPDAPQGNNYLRISNACGVHYQGLRRNFGTSTPGYVSYWVRVPNVSGPAQGYFVIGENPSLSTANQMAFCYFNGTGNMQLVGPGTSTPVVANQWYHVEFRNINYSTRRFDWYVNESLISASVSFRGTNVTNNEVHIYNYNGTYSDFDEVMIFDCDSSAVPWININPNPILDTVFAGDTVYKNVELSSCGLTIGQYSAEITVSSNDPLNPLITVPVVFNVIGAAELTITDSCIYFDTIMELNTVTDTFLITNTGCDTLNVYALTSQNFYIDSLGNDSAGGDLLPGETAYIPVIFAPDSAGNFTGTLSIFSNAGDTVVCLNGFAYPKPVICNNPDSFYVYFPVCIDSVNLPFLICNSGGSDLFWNIIPQTTVSDDFDPGINPALWSSFSGVVNTNCTPFSGNGLWFDNAGVRQATTNDLNTSGGGNVSFYIRLPQLSSPCEAADVASENVVLEYSNNGGGSWFTITTFVFNAYPNLTFINQPIPPAAQTVSTRFRWRQLGNSGSGFDNWILDNITITVVNPNIIPSPSADTTAVGDTTLVNILFTGNGLAPGTYSFQFFVNSNDPVTPQLVIPVVFDIDSVTPPPPVAYDTSVCQGFPNPPLIAVGDSIRWYSDPTLLTLVGTGNSYVPADVLPGVYDYFATSTDSFGCESQADSAYFTISTASTDPAGITITPDSICPGISTQLKVTGGSLGVGAQWVWYADSCGGTPVGTGDSIIVTPPVTTVYFVRAESSCDTTACAWDTVNVSGVPSTAAASVSTTGNNTCPGQSVTLKPVGGSLGTGASWKWFSASCGGSFIASADSIVVSPAATTAYYVRAEGTCNTTTCATITINVTNTLSSAPTGATTSANPTCPGQTVTLTRTGGTLGTGATWQWYSASCGGTPEGSGTTLVVSPLVTTTYYVRAEGTCNTTACASVTVNATNTSSTITAVNASPTTICNGDTSQLSVAGILGTGASWQWYTASCGGTSAGTGASISVNPNDTTIYYVRAEGTCNTTACLDVTLNVNPVPALPTASDTSACEGGGIPDLTATGTNPKWYSDPALTVLEYAGSPFATGQTVGGIYSYYVTDSANGCTSPSDTVTLTINSASTAPTGATTSADSTCPGTTVTLTRTGGVLGVGAQWVWYSSSCGGTSEGTDTSITDAPTVTTIYYVRAEGACNTTACANITVSVTKSPSTAATGINASTNNICPSQSVTLNPIGGSLGTAASWKWFDGGCSSGFLGSGDSITVNPAVTTTYYVKAEGTCNTTGCVSITINVTNTLSTAPTGVTASVNPTCPSQSTTLTRTGGSLGTGASYVWYADSCSGVPIGTGNSIVVSPADTTTYYVRAEGTCNTTACASVTINVSNTLSTDPASASATPPTICNGDTSALSVNGGSLGTGAAWQWYTVSCGGTSVGSGASIQVNPNDTTGYYVRAEGTCNTTVCAVVTLNVNPIPVAPLAGDTFACEGGIIPDLTSNGSNPKWYSDSALTVFEYAGSPFATGETVGGMYTYYVTDSVNGCTGPSTTVTLTINSGSTAPTGATTSADSTCPGTSSTLTVTGGVLGVGAQWVWYDGSCGGTAIGTDTSVSVSPLVTTAYYVRAEGSCDTTVCASVTVDVTKSPSTAATGINASTNNICPSQAVTLKPIGGSLGTSASWKWFDGGCSSGYIGSGDSITVNPAVTTIYYVKAEGTCNTTGCASVTINVTNTLSTDPTGATVSVDSICPAQSTNITVSGGSLGTGAVWNWYSDSCDGAYAGTGSTISVAPSVTTTYYVKAEGTCNTTACINVTVNVSGVVSTAASSATATPATVCNGDSSVLTLSGGSLGTGAQWQWYSAACGGTPAGSSSSITAAPNDTTTYYVRAEGACNTTACVSVTLNVNPIPPAPLAYDTSACEGGVIPPLTAVGSNPKWYSDPALTVLEFVGPSFATGDTAAGTYTYYVTDSANGCEGPPTTVSLTIGSPSVPPAGLTASADSVCPGTSIVLARSGGSLGVGAQWVWYADSCGGTSTGSGDSVLANPLATTQYYLRAESACDTTACANITINVTQTPSAAASSINGSTDSICPGEPVILSVAGGNLGTGASWQWYADSCSGVALASGDSVTFNPLVTTTYFVRAEGSCNTTSCTSITISVTNTLSTAATSATPTVDPTCPAQSTDLSLTGGSLGSGAVWNWYSDSCNGTSVGSGTLITVVPAVTTTYFVKAEGVCNTTTCVSVTVNVTNTVSAAPATATATPVAICYGGSSTLGVNGGSLGTGASWQWYTDSCAGTPAGNGLSVTVSPVITTSYYVRAEGVCNTTACVSVTVNVNVPPAAPTASSESVCEFDSIPPLTATGTGVQWYSDSSLTILVYSGNSFTTGDSVAGIYTYYATQTDTSTGCESQAALVTLMINALPGAPAANDTTVLYGSPVPSLVATGTNVQWYSDSLLTSVVATGNSYATGDTAVGVYIYYATQTDSITGCESPAEVVTLTIIPGIPAITDAIICEGEAGILSATGSNIQWYSDSALTMLVYAGTPFTTGDTATGVYTYYATQTVSGFESSPAIAILTINPVPPPPVLSADTVICFGIPTPDLMASGGLNVQWYSDAGLTNLVSTGDTFTTGITAGGVYTFYSTQSALNCESAADSVTLTINQTPQPLALDTSLCVGDAVPPLTTTGINIKWYSDPALTVLVATGNFYNSSDSAAGVYNYYVTDSLNGCISSSDTSTLIISTPNAPPTGVIADADSICEGAPVNLAVNGGALGVGSQWVWYADSCSGIPVASGDTVTVNPAVTTIYYVRGEGGCDTTSCQNITVNVTQTVSVAATSVMTSVDSICPGAPAILTFSGGSPGTGASWFWYGDSCGGTALGSGDSVTVSPTITSTYFLRAEGTCNTTVCTPVTVNVTKTTSVDASAVLSSGDSLCPNTSVTLAVSGGSLGTGASWQWYVDSCSGISFAAGDSAAAVLANSSTYFVRAEGTCNTTGCTPITISVTQTLSSDPVSAIASVDTICPGVLSVLSVTGGSLGSGAVWNWYTDSCNGTLAGTGDSLPVAPLVTTTYYVKAEGSCNTTACANVTISVTATPSTNPALASASQATVCSGDSTTLTVSGGSLGTGASWIWHADSCNGAITGIGTTINVAPNDTTTYFVRAEGNCNTTSCVSVTVNVNAIPPAPVTGSATVCENDTIPDLSATGINPMWYSDSALSVVIGYGNLLTTGQTLSGTYVYYVTDSINGCTGTASAATLTINPVPAPPIASADTLVCYGSVTPDLIASGGLNTQWYSDAGLTVLVNTGDTFATGLTNPGTFAFYVTQSVLGCESAADSVTLTIFQTPSPVSSDTAVCVGDPVPDLYAFGTNVEWYGDSALTTLLFSGNSFTMGQSSAGSYTYYATQTLNGCVSQRTAATLVINSLPSAPVSSDVTVCVGAPVPDLVAGGSNIQWYNDSLLTMLVYSGDTFTTGQTSAGTYIYYATQLVSGCEGPSVTVTLTILLTPPLPVVSDISVCEGMPVPSFTATGTMVQWYSDSGLTNLVNTGNSYSTGQTLPGVYTYYVTDSFPGCVSPAEDAVLTITPKPAKPVGTDVTVCYGDTVPDLFATGSSPRWYKDPTLVVLIGMGNYYSTGITSVGTYNYYVVDYVAGCPQSVADTVSLTINPKPLVTLNYTTTAIALGDSVQLIAYNAVTYSWSPVVGLSATTGQSVWASPTSPTWYYVTGTNAYGCSNVDSVYVNVKGAGIMVISPDGYEINLYPNPIKDKVMIEFVQSSLAEGKPSLRVFTMIGEMIMDGALEPLTAVNGSSPVSQYRKEIDFSERAEGVYSLQVVTGEMVIVRKVVVVR